MSRIFRISALFFTLIAGLTLAFAVFPAFAGPTEATLYAAPTPNGAGDCSSWADTCTLQTALSNATSGDQIWVQAGLHKPGTTVSDTFALVNGVAVYGGFDGTETALEQRDWETNITVLSGDIDNNDLTDPNGVVTDTANIVGDNTYHVVTSREVLSNTVLDGFVITAGQADKVPLQDRGGGMVISHYSMPVLTNLIFSGNYGESGGGMVNLGSNPTLTNVIFHANTAYYGGGGLYNFYGDPRMENVIFSNNRTKSEFAGNGGGINHQGGVISLKNVIFFGNVSQVGGGIVNFKSIILTNAIFWGNSASWGPQILNSSDATNVVSYSDIEGSGGSGVGWDPSLGTDAGGNIDADPLFVDTLNGDLHLELTSPAIDAGNNLSVTVTTDLDGNPRFSDIPTVPDTGNGTPPIVDIGAYEANMPPVFTSTPVTTATQDMLYTYTITATDPDLVYGGVLTLTAPTLPAWLTLTDHGNGTATLTGTPTNTEVGAHPVLLRVTDSGGLFAEQAFTLTVTNLNDAPSITSTPMTTTAEDALYTYTLTTTDPDLSYGDTLTLSAPTLPAWLTFTDHSDGTATLTGTPTSANVGEHIVVSRVADREGAFTEQTFVVTVSEIANTYFIYLPLLIRNTP